MAAFVRHPAVRRKEGEGGVKPYGVAAGQEEFLAGKAPPRTYAGSVRFPSIGWGSAV